MDSRMRRVLPAVAAATLLLVVALVGVGVVPIGVPSHVAGSGHISPAASGNFDQLVVVLMENKNLNEVYGPAPYLTGLADQYAFSQHWASITNPSQPNYIALLGGSTFGVTGDGAHPNLNRSTMVDLFVNSGKTWKAFAEDATGTGCGLSPPRGEDHFPFLSFTTITRNASRCANLLPGSSNEVIAEFNKGTNFIWLTPNDCNNMHDCSVTVGDNWTKSWVPNLLSAMAGKRAALIIMFDEAYTSPPYIYMGFSGPATKSAYKSTAEYTHYSLLKLIEDVWGGGSLGQGDVNATSPVEFFNPGGPDFSLAASPPSVSFLEGQSATSTIGLHSMGGFNRTVNLTASSAPAGVTASCVPAKVRGNQSSVCTMSSGTRGSYVVTVTGTNGTFTNSVAVDVTVTGPDFSLSANPGSVSFVAGQSGTSTVALRSTGGFTGAVALTMASAPAGVTTSCIPSGLTGSQTSTCTLRGTTAGSYTVTVTGTNGTLVHSTSIAATVIAAGPTARFTYAPGTPHANNSVTFDASSSSDLDPSATLQARWDWSGDGVWDTAFSSSLTVQHVFTMPGTYSVKLEIQDSHGLTDSTSQSISVLASGSGDKTPPQLLITFPTNDSVLTTANVTVTGIAADNIAIKSIELSTDNRTWTPTSGTIYWSGQVTIKDGQNTIYARATDVAGNKKTVRISVMADIDQTAPLFPIPSTPGMPVSGFPWIQVILLIALGSAAEAGLFVTYRQSGQRARRDRVPVGSSQPRGKI